MIIDISYGNQRIAEINYDKGIDQMEVEILPQEEGGSKRVFPMEDFLCILEKAKAIAAQCAKEDEQNGEWLS